MSHIVIDMNPRALQCFICNQWTDTGFGVPTCNGDVVSNDFPDEIWHEHGGGQGVCEECHKKHERGLIRTFDRYYLHLAKGFIGGDGILPTRKRKPKMNALQCPDSSGWWLWYEHGDLVDDDPERLLIEFSGHATVVEDDELCEALGIDMDNVDQSSGFVFNDWSGSDCAKDMGCGLWVKDANQESPPLKKTKAQRWYRERDE